MKLYPKEQSIIYVGMILLACIFGPIIGVVLAQTWHTANQTTVAWDAVTTNTAGDAIPEGESIKYSVWVSNADTDPDKANPVKVATSIAETQYTVTLNTEGKYFIGVQSERWLGDDMIESSVIAWSDDPEAAQGGNDFGIRYYLPPAAPGGLRNAVD